MSTTSVVPELDSSAPASLQSTKPSEDPPSSPTSKALKVLEGSSASGGVSSNASSSSTISATIRFTHNSIKYRSIGTCFSPERLSLEEEDLDKDKVVEPVDLFKRLPREVVRRILRWTLKIGTSVAEEAYRVEDIRQTGWLPGDKDNLAGKERARSRFRTLTPLMSVCRLWYDVTLPWMWEHLDLSSCTSYSGRHCFAQLLTAPRTIAARSTTPPPAVNGTITTDEDGDEIMELQPSPTITLTTITLPTLGSYVREYTIGSNDDCVAYFFQVLVTGSLTSSLKTINFPLGRSIRNSQLASLALHLAGPTLRQIHGLHLVHINEDVSIRFENILTLFNHSPNIEKFGVSGEGFALSEAFAKRLSFVWKLNATLKHKATETLGVGMKELYFGPGCSLPVSFVRGLTESTPRLNKLHITEGVKILPDTSALGQQPFDLRSFATSWGDKLTALTLLSNETFSTINLFDDVLKLCPNLLTLHLRSDHITFTFFRTLIDLMLKPDPDAPLSSSSTPTYEKLRHPLQALAITHRLPPGETIIIKNTQTSITLFPPAFIPFSNALLRIEARTRLPCPSEMGGQRDVLERAALLAGAGSSGGGGGGRWKGVTLVVGGKKGEKGEEMNEGARDLGEMEVLSDDD